jgi:carboxyl-terminal processing protease
MAPFADLDRAAPVWLEFLGREQVAPLLGLVRAERAEFEAVLGTSVEFVRDARPGRQRWRICSRTAAQDYPALTWDPVRGVLTSWADTTAEFASTLNLLHTLAHSHTTTVSTATVSTATVTAVSAAPTTSSGEAFDRIYTEVANTFPGFALRGLDWDRITERHAHVRELDGEEFTVGVQRWIAELGDAHTAARPPTGRFHPPYHATMTRAGAQLSEVPAGSAAHRAGARAGWWIQVTDPTHWLRITGATPQQHARVAARNFLAMTHPRREFTAHDGRRHRTTWVETPTTPTMDDTLRWRHRPGRHTYARLTSFDGSLDLAGGFDRLLTEAHAHRSRTLLLDLRGNTGGSLCSATALRDRFLRTTTRLGSIAFTTGTGQLADPVPLTADPSTSTRWDGDLRVLVDAMTYSAAEDFLLGLHGLDHITVLGEPTGGGSGRPRSLPITPELTLTISTALTYDRHGRCIEHHGLPVDKTHPS